MQKKGTFQVQMNNAPQGTRIVTEQGEVKETFQLGEKFRIQVPKSSKSSELSLKSRFKSNECSCNRI